MVESVREIVGGKTEHETRFYISSLDADAERQGEAIRSHWGVENSHHWVMDMLFRDDECRIRTANAPANFVTIKHMAGNLLRRGAGKQSLESSAASPPGTTNTWSASSRARSVHPIPLRPWWNYGEALLRCLGAPKPSSGHSRALPCPPSPGRGCQAIASSPLCFTMDNSLTAAPVGRRSPRSHCDTNVVGTLR